MRRSRQEILDLYRACQAKLGKSPGLDAFCKVAGLKPSEIYFYWPRASALIAEAGGQVNEFASRLPDDDVFADYAKVCLHLGKIPSMHELRITQRELKTCTTTVYTRLGSIQEFQKQFREWLSNGDEELKAILEYKGWAGTRNRSATDNPQKQIQPQPQLHPYLPGCLQYLDVLARGEFPPFESSDVAPSTIFERRTSDAFRCLGFEIRQFGQGTGRNPDTIACAQRERVALIIDAKVRANGYVLGTEDRKFLEYAVTHGQTLQKQGFEKLYLIVVGPSFKESDLTRLAEYLSDSPIRSVVMITAIALMRIVEESIRERSHFSLTDLSKQFFGNKLIQS